MENDYKVLYRKYRPKNFDEVIGQKYTIQMLKNAVINNQLAHAYIFTGPRGTGKTSTAKIFAKTINCENLVDGKPCEKCNSCINMNHNADIIEIDAASNNGVDEIRELINNVKIAPSFSKYKIYIIDEVHMLSESAFNALLLTLEEPPAHIIFILATTNIEKVPITILSRCQRYDFKKIDQNEIVNHLKNICQKEKITITDEALEEIAYLSDGGLRDALSILNQLYTSSNAINLETVIANYGSVSSVQIQNIITAFLEDNYAKIKEIFANLTNNTADYKIFIKKLVDGLFAESLKLKGQGNDAAYSKLKQIIFELNDLLNKININIDPFLLIFMIFVENMTIPLNSDKKEETIKEESQPKVETKKEKTKVEKIKAEDNQNDTEYHEYLEKLKQVRLNNCFALADKKYLLPAKDKWQEFIANVSSSEIKSIVIDCEVVLASLESQIVVHANKSGAELFNHHLEEIENLYNTSYNTPIKFIAFSADEWEESKKKYVQNLKDGYKYQKEEEPVYNPKSSENKIDSGKDIETSDIMDIFDREKVEIE